MNALEQYCIALRHLPVLENSPLWTVIRPLYDIVLGVIASKKGLERIMNGSDPLRLHPLWRGISESYEPDVWKHLMGNVREGDTVVDIGAFVGLYTVTLAKRVGAQGSVIAFEPDPENFRWLQQHVILNHVEDQVKLCPVAMGNQAGEVGFMLGQANQSRIEKNRGREFKLHVTTLDIEFANRRVDLLKIDVEGFEEKVLRGGIRLLGNMARCPRIIYIEIHPYAWEAAGTSGKSLLSLLEECDYEVSGIDGEPAKAVDSYGEIVARKKLDRR
jgi:FkbM family methyltransferase